MQSYDKFEISLFKRANIVCHAIQFCGYAFPNLCFRRAPSLYAGAKLTYIPIWISALIFFFI